MQTITIAAVADNGVIGDGSDIPWRLPEDWTRFKELTTDNYVVMGRNTYESIGKPLPNRTTFVVTRNPDYEVPAAIGATRVFVARDVEDALAQANVDRFAAASRVIWIAGGGEIYAQTMSQATALEITQVHQHPAGNVFFPEIDQASWLEIKREPHDGYDFVRYAPITYTDRLTLRPVTQGDFDDWYGLHSDPRAFPKAPDAVLTDTQVCSSRLVDHERSWMEDGLGYWVAHTADGTFIGAGGVKRLPVPNSGDFFWNLYFRIVPEFMGNGYSVEIARAAVHALVRIHPHARVRMVLRAENRAVSHVAEKLGLGLLAHRIDDFGQPQAVYQGVAKDLRQG